MKTNYLEFTEEDIAKFREALETDLGPVECSDAEIAEMAWNTVNALALLQARTTHDRNEKSEL